MAKIPSYLYEHDADTNFSMVTSDLLLSDAYQNLSHAARGFYIVLITHKHTPEQRQCLFKALCEYYELTGNEKPIEDIKGESGQVKKWHGGESKKFVCPDKHLQQYGYKSSYATKLKKELIEAGFIKVFANEKGQGKANRDFSKRVTIYEFSNAWKK